MLIMCVAAMCGAETTRENQWHHRWMNVCVRQLPQINEMSSLGLDRFLCVSQSDNWHVAKCCIVHLLGLLFIWQSHMPDGENHLDSQVGQKGKHGERIVVLFIKHYRSPWHLYFLSKHVLDSLQLLSSCEESQQRTSTKIGASQPKCGLSRTTNVLDNWTNVGWTRTAELDIWII